ncbi:MAG TPA: hypothetical protein ENN46_03735 [Candidatus Woesearchaeota archaeon]|nr:hypothetical protein [Candidatus Woesearchaeota archaeon]
MASRNNLLVLAGILIFAVSTAIQAGLVFDIALLSARMTEPQSGEIIFCIEDTRVPKVSYNFNIQEDDILSGRELIKLTLNNPIPSENISVFYWMRDRLGNSYFSTKPVRHLSDFLYNLDTTLYPDRNCFYDIGFVLHTNRSFCYITYADSRGSLSINNLDIAPRWNQFRHPYSTDLDSFSSWTRLSNITLFKENTGFIEMGGDTFWNLDDADLDKHIIFEQKRFFLNESISYCLHKSMMVTFFNFTWEIPLLLWNGQDCTAFDSYDRVCERVYYDRDNHRISYIIYKTGNYELWRNVSAELDFLILARDNYSSYYMNQDFFLNQDIYFWLNYSIFGDIIDFSEVNCSISIMNFGNWDEIISSYDVNFDLSRAKYYSSNLSSIDFMMDISSNDLGIGSYLARASCNASHADPGVPYRYNDFAFFVRPFPVDVTFWSETQPLEHGTINSSARKEFSINDRKVRHNNDTPMAFISVQFNNKTSSEIDSVTARYKCDIDWGDGQNTSSVRLNSFELVNITLCNQLNQNCSDYSIAKLPHKYRWPGDYPVNISCWLYDGNVFADFNKMIGINITNRRPQLIHDIPDAIWLQDRMYSPYHLEDYFYDPDGEELVFDSTPVDSIMIHIDKESSLVNYIPDVGFSGSRTVYFYATDPGGLVGSSNEVNLTVVPTHPEPTQDIDEDFGRYGDDVFVHHCQERWNCTEWGPCMPSEIQIRKCVDMANCNTTYNKPPEWRFCIYTPTCYDGIKNQGELGVDCGGPCPPCPSCNDGIKNQGEEGIDCGGPCPPCPTCYDGIKNCHILPNGNIVCEEGIDCGGPCPPCVEVQRPGLVRSLLINHLNEFLIFGSLSLLAALLVYLAASKIPRVALFISKAFDKLINALTLPTFKEFNLYTELVIALSSLEKYFEKGRRDIILNRIDSIFKRFSGFLFSCPEGSAEQEIIEKANLSSLRNSDKMLIELFLTKLSFIKYSNDINAVSKAKLRDLLVKLKLIIARNKTLLYKIQVEKELEAIRAKMNILSNAKSLAENRLLYNLIREVYLFSGYVESKKLKKALQTYESIQKLYKQLSWWNRIKVCPRIAPKARQLKELMRKKEQK